LLGEPNRCGAECGVRFGEEWIADSEGVRLLHEPDRYPVAYFPIGDVRSGLLQPIETVTNHRDLGATSWFTVEAGGKSVARGAWEHTALPKHAGEPAGRVAFAWRSTEAFYEEDERQA
jgi:uncharacterized protein (DUF427 family)